MAELKKIRYGSDDNGTNNHGYENGEEFKEASVAVNGFKDIDKPELTEKEKYKAKLKIVKNLLTVSFGFFLLFTAFQSLSNLQSSINRIDGLGTASLSVIYASLVVSCMFVPPYMIATFGCKYTLVIAMLMYSTYFMANFYAQWYTMIPTAIILGLGGAPLWSAKCTYLTEIANQYAGLIGESSESVVSKFFGVFFMLFQSSQIVGNLISSFVLERNVNVTDVENNEEILGLCGINFCNDNIKGTKTNENLVRPPDSKVYMLCGIYLGCALLGAFFVFIVLDQLKRSNKEKEGIKSGAAKPSLNLLVATFRHMANKKQILVIPLTIYSGIEQGFLASDFTQAYISCAWGIQNIGFVLICFGTSNAISSLLFGPLVKIIGRIPIFVFGAFINSAVVVSLFVWAPNPEEKIIYFVIAGLWGIGDAVWQTQINSLYGVLFAKNEEAAFSNYRLWESIGFIMVFAYSNYLCVRIKLYVLMVFLVLGMIGYFIVEVIVSREKAANKKQ